jgi:hypothetical protein
VEALNAVAVNVASVMYVSCNVESMTRDVHLFKCNYFIRDAVVFDFFPGTAYVMSMLVLEPFAASPRRMLVLPVGPPLIGKSSSARHLRDLAEASSSSASMPPSVKCQQHALRQRCGVVSVVREMPRIENQLQVVLFERDDVFHRFKAAGYSLREAKERTHAALVAALRGSPADGDTSSKEGAPFFSSVLCLDSTNGSAEARALYADTWLQQVRPRGDEQEAPLVQVLVVWMKLPAEVTAGDPQGALEALCQRASRRSGHPAFPIGAEQQRKKITDVMNSIEEVRGGNGRDDERICVTALENGTTELETSGAFASRVFFCLFCSASLAKRLLQRSKSSHFIGNEGVDDRSKRSRSPDV